MPDKLRPQLEIEAGNLDRLLGEMKLLLAEIEERKSFVEVRAAGSILHDFYSGIEKIFKRIAVSVDKSFPQGENWHTELLLQMTRAVEGKRDRVITEDLGRKLKEYLRFRHLFRHIYGFELTWDRIKPLCVDMETLIGRLKREVDDFLRC